MMNERFTQLLSQSWHECRKEQEVNDPARYYSDKGPNIDAVYEKFAELIVRECLTFVEPMPGSGDIDDLALEAAHNSIKEHFGVEE